MPQHEIEIEVNDEELAVLERLREREGLPSVDAVVEWLTKSRIRRVAKNMNGRARTMRLVDGRDKT